jgi:membrane protease YdiL (CAAX protease family)
MKRENAVLVIVSAVVVSYVVSLIGQIPRGVLAQANLATTPAIPWGPVLVAIWLAVFAKATAGPALPAPATVWPTRWYPHAPLSGAMRRRALVATAFISVASRMLLDLGRRLSTRPAQDLEQFTSLSRYPAVTAVLILLSIAATAGVVEEIAFRGYLQHPFERRFGPRIAVALSAAFFALAHYRFNAPDPIPWLIFIPCYLYVGVAFGALTVVTGSVVPGMIGHFAIDAVPLIRYTYWGIPRPVRETGLDTPFIVESAIAAIATLGAVWALRRVVELRRAETSRSVAAA